MTNIEAIEVLSAMVRQIDHGTLQPDASVDQDTKNKQALCRAVEALTKTPAKPGWAFASSIDSIILTLCQYKLPYSFKIETQLQQELAIREVRKELAKYLDGKSPDACPIDFLQVSAAVDDAASEISKKFSLARSLGISTCYLKDNEVL